jgi:glucose uptake protein GlcU
VQKTSLNIGVLLIILGFFTFVATEFESYTALIPAAFGLVFAALGLLSKKVPDMERTFMNAGMLLAIFGLAATAEAIALFAGALTGNPPERMITVGGRAMMAVLCGAFILFRLKEFLKTMKSRNG